MTDNEALDWDTEEVRPSQLRIGDVVKQGGNMPWVTVVEIHEAGDSQPEWERRLGKRMFVCEHFDENGKGRRLLAYDNHDQCLVTRRRV